MLFALSLTHVFDFFLLDPGIISDSGIDPDPDPDKEPEGIGCSEKDG